MHRHTSMYRRSLVDVTDSTRTERARCRRSGCVLLEAVRDRTGQAAAGVRQLRHCRSSLEAGAVREEEDAAGHTHIYLCMLRLMAYD